MSTRLHVLSIAHVGVSHANGRLRYVPLAASTRVAVQLLVPARWQEFGRVVEADPPDAFPLPLAVAPIRFGHVPRMSWYAHVYPSLRRRIRALQPDVIHLWEEPWSFVALQAVLLRGDAAIVLEVDQNILKRLPPPFEAIRRYVLARTAVVLVRSPDAEAVVRACGFRGPVMEIGYGVDTATFAPRPAALPQPQGDLMLSYAGRLIEEKGLDDVLLAMSRARARVRLAIRGEGPHGTHLRTRVRELGLESAVSFTGWAKPADVADTYRDSHVSVLLTRTTGQVKEQFGRAIIESQACGVPVIGSTCGAIPSVVGAGGWIVPERDVEALARLLEQLAAAPDVVATARQAALDNVRHRFTYERVAATLEAACLEAARLRPKPTRATGVPHLTSSM